MQEATSSILKICNDFFDVFIEQLFIYTKARAHVPTQGMAVHDIFWQVEPLEQFPVK